jgi:hypothetical protein
MNLENADDISRLTIPFRHSQSRGVEINPPHS